MSITTTIVNFSLILSTVAFSKESGCEETREVTCSTFESTGTGQHTTTRWECEDLQFEIGPPLKVTFDKSKCKEVTDSHPSPCSHSVYTDNEGRTITIDPGDLLTVVSGLAEM
jgi:uncharacterized cupin superfamily protein